MPPMRRGMFPLFGALLIRVGTTTVVWFSRDNDNLHASEGLFQQGGKACVKLREHDLVF